MYILLLYIAYCLRENMYTHVIYIIYTYKNIDLTILCVFLIAYLLYWIKKENKSDIFKY